MIFNTELMELKTPLAYIEVHSIRILLFEAVYSITQADPEYRGTQVLPGQYELVGTFHSRDVCHGAENIFNGESKDEFPLEQVLSDTEVCHPVSIPGSLGRKRFPKIACAQLYPGSSLDFKAVIEFAVP